MGRKKSRAILLVLIIMIIILILLVGVAYCYFATDLLRSNKQLFFKYVGQIGNAENGLIDNNLTTYLEKQKNTPYTNEGDFSLNISLDGENVAEYENLNNFDISFSGQVDKQANKTMQDISLNYSEEVNFPISYKQIADTFGLQTKYVSNKYLAVEKEKLINMSQAEMSIDFESLKQIPFTTEELQAIKDKYMQVIDQQLQDTQFTKLEEGNYIGYQLSLTGENIKNTTKQLLETLKNDETTLTKINEYIQQIDSSAEVDAETIDEYIQDIDEEGTKSEEVLKITVYKQNVQTKKIVLETSEVKIQLEKVKENNILKYILQLEPATEEEQITTVTLSAEYSGLDSMQQINEVYALELAMENEQNISYKYTLNNNITFSNEVEIEEFSKENAMMLTDYDEETVSKFLESVVERIQLVNKNQMEKLGLQENKNPLLQMLMPFTSVLMYSNATKTIDSGTQSMESAVIQTFNSKFLKYESTNLRAPTVKGLLTEIASNNGLDNSDEFIQGEDTTTSNDYLIKEINFNGEEYEVNQQNITFIKNGLNSDVTYRVEFEMDEDTGAIYRAVINEKVGE